MERVPVATSLDGVDVHIDKHAEHAALHLAGNPDLLAGVVEVVENVTLADRPNAFDHDLGHDVGLNHLVLVRPGDHVFYALREWRDLYTPFVTDREPEPTSLVSMVLEEMKYGRELVTAWFGELAPDLPGGRAEQPHSVEFWNSHAFVWGSQPIQPGSKTENRPW